MALPVQSVGQPEIALDQEPPREAAAPPGDTVNQLASTTDPAGLEPPKTVVKKPGSQTENPAFEVWPPDTRVSYRLEGYYRGSLNGSARVQWQRDQNRYQIELEMRMALVIGVSMTSQGEVSDTGLLPQDYEERFLGRVRRLGIENGWLKFNNGSQTLAPPGFQDTASQFVELTQRFASGREILKVGTPVQIWLARPQGLALWTYDVTGEETLASPELGPLSAFHLVPRPIPNPTGVITAEIWFAPSLHYLPIRIHIALGEGNFLDLMVERIEQAALPQ
jgi:hypothetical protein